MDQSKTTFWFFFLRADRVFLISLISWVQHFCFYIIILWQIIKRFFSYLLKFDVALEQTCRPLSIFFISSCLRPRYATKDRITLFSELFLKTNTILYHLLELNLQRILIDTKEVRFNCERNIEMSPVPYILISKFICQSIAAASGESKLKSQLPRE